MHSVSDLTTFARKTLGDVPPRLVGASTTVVGDKMYLFGGRLVSERRMVSDLYMFDLKTFVWSKLEPAPDEQVPGARYFHSMDHWNNHLVIFGGMGYKPGGVSPEDYCVLDDVRFFDLAAHRWKPPAPVLTDPPSAPTLIPRARYAHLSSITSDRLFVIGGQDLSNVWLDDIHVYDLSSGTWVHRTDYPRHCGTYRSVAVSSQWRVRNPQQEGPPRLDGAAGTRFKVEDIPPASPQYTASDSLVHLPYSARPTPEYPNDIYLYSNYNFTDVKRELEVFSPQPGNEFSITDRSSAMGGSALPPGLRFPTGAILGSHLIIAGTYLAHSYQSFSVWALDLNSMVWSRIDPGSTLATGSWCRGCLWESANKFLIFGNREGNLVEDYNRRLLSWDHVAYIDLEAFGIYQPPKLVLDIPSQELGLAAFEEHVLADFEIVCDDARRIKCSRKILEDRWPWFKEQRRLYLQAAMEALKSISAPGVSLPLPELSADPASPEEPRPDPRLTPRALHLSEPYPVTLALVQYFYSMALITPLQHAPAVLSALLLLSSTYQLPHLQTLVTHAMHRALSSNTAVGVYEVATLCNCQSLQIRALKVVMQSSSRRGGGRNRGDRGEPPARNGNDLPEGGSQARPRGLSDARLVGGNLDGGSRTMVNGSNGHTPAQTRSAADSGSTGHTASRTPEIQTKDLSRSRSDEHIERPKTADTTAPTPSGAPSLGRRLASADGPRGEFGASSRTRPPVGTRWPHRVGTADGSLPSVPEAAIVADAPPAGTGEQEAESEYAQVGKTLVLENIPPRPSPLIQTEPLRASNNEPPSVSSSAASTPSNEYEDLFFGTQPDASPVTQSPPVAFHLPFRNTGNPATMLSIQGQLTTSDAPASPGEASLGSSYANVSTYAQSPPPSSTRSEASSRGQPHESISSGSLLTYRTSDSSVDRPLTPPDSQPIPLSSRRAHEEPAKRDSDAPSVSSGSKTPTVNAAVAVKDVTNRESLQTWTRVDSKTPPSPLLETRPERSSPDSALSRFMSITKQEKLKKLEKKGSEPVRPGSSRGDPPSSKEEKKRLKELEKVKLERLAAEAKLRAKKMAHEELPSFFDTGAPVDQHKNREMMAYTSMGGM